MRKTPILFISISMIALIFSCAGAPPRPGAGLGGISATPRAVEGEPEKGGIGYRDFEEVPELPLEIPGFWRTNALYVVLDTLELHDKLGAGEKRALMESLFGTLPADPEYKLLRETMVGGFFTSGKPLRIRAFSLGLDKGKAREDLEIGFMFTTNAIAVVKAGKLAGFKEGSFETPEKNVAFAFVKFANGKFVDYQYLSDPEMIEDRLAGVGEDPLKEAIGLADIYILDQDGANDAEVPGLLEPFLADGGLDPEERGLALANLFQYSLMVGELDAARKALDEASALPLRETGLKVYLRDRAPLLFELIEG